ncbi:hypothetical protein CANMA_003661, partial [Candida margitis]|uniref:uncharacterized protein n=1 Tax=Candida margitis TaxID=1775924 RepID=UPI0022268626
MSKSDYGVHDIKEADKHIENVSVSSSLDKEESVAAAKTNANVDDYISKFLEMSEDARADD